MSDSDSKSSIPQWQRLNSTPSPTSDDKEAGKDTDRSVLLEQASSFLQDDSIRNASTDRKITFLESKGLTSPEIDNLLGVSRNPEATSSNSDRSKESKDTSTSSTETSNQAPSPSTLPTHPPSTQQPTTPAPRDVPPVITYPEFLLHQSKPPPLVTLQSILYTLYGAAGLGATVYGASEYIVKPLLATLTDARHDLAQATEENLKKLNEKLEQNVSEIPPSLLLSAKPAASSLSELSDEDLESITSDPTELFHRDIGTQTSQDLVQPSSTSSSPTINDPESPPQTTTITTHQKRLESIGSHLRAFADAESQSTTLNDTTHSRVSDLQRYLDGLIYSKSSTSYPYSATTGYGVYSTPGLDYGSGGAATGAGRGEEDAISGFRAEIRGVKGALLSARNFPSGRGGGRGGVRASVGR
ncbi:peroxisomal membrane anchor protein conserved region-domain-containing protein [Aspergillus cavernicola]|uniref:Peroxisomal membrane protein PEX14 n=1 Tax=Aspergillus cavernicola TaxID=176166 RepID=A0ABR4IBM8_9EURO